MRAWSLCFIVGVKIVQTEFLTLAYVSAPWLRKMSYIRSMIIQFLSATANAAVMISLQLTLAMVHLPMHIPSGALQGYIWHGTFTSSFRHLQSVQLHIT